MRKYDINEIQLAIENTNTMLEASSSLDMPFSSFKRICKKIGIYNPNQGRKGISREDNEYSSIRIPLSDILNGDFPNYSTSNLKRRLINDGIKINICEICNISEWNGLEIICELDHIDGNSRNHKLDNLRMICPNCHSQTNTYSGKNKRLKFNKSDIIKLIPESKSYSDLKRKIGMCQTGNNNKTINAIMSDNSLKFM